MQDVYKNIEEHYLEKKRKVLIVFDDMIADIINDKKLNSIVAELFIRGRKLNISFAFITQSHFKVPKFYTRLYYGNFKPKRTSTDCNKSFIRYRF